MRHPPSPDSAFPVCTEKGARRRKCTDVESLAFKFLFWFITQSSHNVTFASKRNAYVAVFPDVQVAR
jgi:hypothetical protein